MASITIRRLDDNLKKRLRLRAARNGRSMEDEVRTILHGAAAAPGDAAPAARRSGPAAHLVTPGVTSFAAPAQHFITPLWAGARSGERVFTDLFDASGELDVGHIRLARDADLIVVAP